MPNYNSCDTEYSFCRQYWLCFARNYEKFENYKKVCKELSTVKYWTISSECMYLFRMYLLCMYLFWMFLRSWQRLCSSQTHSKWGILFPIAARITWFSQHEYVVWYCAASRTKRVLSEANEDVYIKCYDKET